MLQGTLNTNPATAYVGTWIGNISMSDSSMVTFTRVQQPGDTGSFTFACETTSSPTKTVTVTDDSLVFDLQRAIRAPNHGVDSGMARVVVTVCDVALTTYIPSVLAELEVSGHGSLGERSDQ